MASFSILWRISCGVTAPSPLAAALPCGFQYSLANLVWCNTTRILSRNLCTTRFSILWRISCGVTRNICSNRRYASLFQYSLANLVWCNAHWGNITFNAYEFQYSLANLVWCNSPPGRKSDVFSRFSILWRISCGVTLVRASRYIRGMRFQYSLANLVWCNLAISSRDGGVDSRFSILWRISCGVTRY